MKVQANHGKVTQNMHGASRNYRYVWDVSVAQEQVDVNFISRNNFNNNAYRSNFASNFRPFPSNNYGNNNTYPSNKNSTSELESMLKELITIQKAFNKTVEKKLDKLDNLSLKVDNLALDVEMLRIRTSPLEETKATSY